MSREDRWGTYGVQRLSRRRVLQGAVIGAAGLGLAGCTTTSATPTAAPAATAPAAAAAVQPTTAPQPTAAPQPKRGGTVKTMATLTERNLEPHATGGITGGSVGAAVCYSTLLTYKWGPDIPAPSYIPTGDLAESWTQADDLNLVFKLRPGVKWHNIAPVNGRDLVADDLIFSFDRVREKKNYASYLAGISKMEAVDKLTLKLTLDKPNADLLDNLAQNTLLIVARERVQQANGSLDDAPLIGTGAFILDKFEAGQRVVSKRNPDYFVKDRPYIDGIESLRVTADPSLMTSSFRAGTSNYLGSGVTLQMADDVRKAVASAVITYLPVDRSPAEFGLNASLDLFKDVRVRQAISKAIDRKAIISAGWQGRAVYYGGLSLPDPSFGLPAAELSRLLDRDVDGAKKLLSEAGVSGLNFEIAAPNYLAGTLASVAELIQANLKEVGITTSLKVSDTTGFTTAQQTGNFQSYCAVASMGAPNGWLYARYYTGAPQNWSKFATAEMDKLIDQQAVLVKDPEGRKKILQDVQRKIISDAVYSPLVTYQTANIKVPELMGFTPPTILQNHNLLWTTAWFDK